VKSASLAPRNGRAAPPPQDKIKVADGGGSQRGGVYGGGHRGGVYGGGQRGGVCGDGGAAACRVHTGSSERDICTKRSREWPKLTNPVYVTDL